MWNFGGVASVNTVLAFKELSKHSFIARLDDDDYYFMFHLERLIAGFAFYNADFIWTSADHRGHPYPNFQMKYVYLNNALPAWKKTIHATTSWKYNRRLFYRSFDQKYTDPIRCCDYRRLQPGDGDLWSRFNTLISSGNMTCLFDQRPSVFYESQKVAPAI